MIYSTSLICCDQANVRAEVRNLVNVGFTDFHADFMDGHFVPRLGICPEVIRDLRNSFGDEITIGSHLMMSDPIRFIDVIAQYSNTIWVHREISSPLKVIEYINNNYPNVTTGFAYNLETPLDDILRFTQTGIDSILLMGINPGVLTSKKYPGLVYSRAKALKSFIPDSTKIFIDGAVSFDTMPHLKDYCDGVVCGSSTVYKDAPRDEKSHRVDAVYANVERLKSL